jgi:hypothetical protein
LDEGWEEEGWDRCYAYGVIFIEILKNLKGR